MKKANVIITAFTSAVLFANTAMAQEKTQDNDISFFSDIDKCVLLTLSTTGKAGEEHKKSLETLHSELESTVNLCARSIDLFEKRKDIGLFHNKPRDRTFK